MTIITKPSLIVKKTVIPAASPDEEKIEMHLPEWRLTQKESATMTCLSLVVIGMALGGLTCGVLLYRQYLSNVSHYRAFCAIPIDLKQHLEREMAAGQDHRAEQVQWSRNSDIQVVSPFREDEAEELLLSTLREELDISENIESISILDDGRTITFVHNFNDNTSAIVDVDRCFVMQLELGMAVTPEDLVAGIEDGVQWDASPVHSTLRAVLPQLTTLPSAMAASCRNRPSYRLLKDNAHVRKRSAEEPKHEYVHFAGNHLQQIAIDNMAEVLEYERKHLH